MPEPMAAVPIGNRRCPVVARRLEVAASGGDFAEPRLSAADR
jgi:hypothetical protein